MAACTAALVLAGACTVEPPEATALGEAYRLRDAGTGVERLVELCGHEDPTVRRAAADALGAVGADAAVPTLAAMLADEEPTVRYAAAFSLGRIGALEALRERVVDPDPNLRLLAVRALGHRGGEGDVSVLAARLREDDVPPVRGEAAIALGRLGGDGARAALGQRLSMEGESEVRWRLAWALGASGASDAERELSAMAFDEGRPRLERVFALRALVAVARDGVSVEDVARVARSADPLVASAGAELLARLRSEGAAPSREPIADEADPALDQGAVGGGPVPGDGIPAEFLATQPVLRFATAKGEFDVALAPGLAPVHAWNLLQLAAQGELAGRVFFAVEPGRWVAGGGADGDDHGPMTRTGGFMRAEVNAMPFLTGTVGAWRRPGSGVSADEFFITHAPAPELDGEFTAFGRVVRGQDVVMRIAAGDTVENVVVLGAGAQPPMTSAGR